MVRKVWTAAELEKLPPNEVDEIFRASIVTDLSTMPPEFLEQVRAGAARLIEEREGTRAD